MHNVVFRAKRLDMKAFQGAKGDRAGSGAPGELCGSEAESDCGDWDLAAVGIAVGRWR